MGGRIGAHSKRLGTGSVDPMGWTMSTGVRHEKNKTEEEQTLDYDDRFDLLSNHRRRYTLHYLERNNGRAELGELAEQLAAWENGIEKTEISYDQRKRVYTSLQQVHLPQMDKLGILTFDEREGVAAQTRGAEEFDFYFEIVGRQDIPWSVFYLLLGGVDAVILTGGAAGVGPLAVVPGIGWGVFVLTTFLVVSLAHLYVSRTEMRLGEKQKPPDVAE